MNAVILIPFLQNAATMLVDEPNRIAFYRYRLLLHDFGEMV
jgi:hypothetical protein